MRKFLIAGILLILLSSQAVAGDSLLVAIRGAEDIVGVGTRTEIPDSMWNQWANEGYQYCLTNGFAYIRQTVLEVKPYAFPDSDNYALPTDFYEWLGARVISNATRDKRNIQLMIFGQEHEIGRCEGTGQICYATYNEDSIQFFPNPARYDTVLLYYYSDDATLADDDVMKIKKVYTPIVVNYILSRYFHRMPNLQESSYYRQLAEAELTKLTELRRKVRADIIIPPEIEEK